jgi:hypothetical protein
MTQQQLAASFCLLEQGGGTTIPWPSRASVTTQVWVGNHVDRPTRTMAGPPTLLLHLQDHAAVEAARQTYEAVQTARMKWYARQILPGTVTAPPDAGALAVVSMDVETSAEDEFNDWYSTEHIPLVAAVPGVLMARRFRARAGQPRYIATYHLRDPGTYAHERWQQANVTPWILRMRRFQKNRHNFLFIPWTGTKAGAAL